MFPPPKGPIFFRKNTLKYMILQSLSKKPVHGYELMRSLGEEFGGIQRPSAGAIYPTLQALEDEGYVKYEEKEGKKIYSITTKGMEFTEKSESEFKSLIEKGKDFIKERRELNRELRNLVSLIMTNYHDMEIEKVNFIAEVLKDVRRKVSDIIFE